MKQTVSQSTFINAFQSVRPENFSYDGLCALFDYLEELEADTGEEMELDVIAICCDYSEYESAREAAAQYGWEPDEDDNEEDQAADALQWLQDRTTVILVDGDEAGRVITQDF